MENENPRYLSKVITDMKENGEDILADNKPILITAGVGAGKNTWVKDYLATPKNKVFFITSRKMTKNQMKDNVKFSDNYNECIDESLNYVISHQSLEKFFKDEYGITKLKKLKFKYLVIDEIHCVISDSTYTNSAFYIICLIKYILENRKDVKIIGMSATNRCIKKYFESIFEFTYYDFSAQCVNIKPKKIVILKREDALKLLATANTENKMIYMANSAKKIVNSITKKLLNIYKVHIDSLGILANETKIKELKKEQKEEKIIYILNKADYISLNLEEDKKLPSEINILLSTSRLREGVSILDKNIKAMFCESHDMIDIIQFTGRNRIPIDTLYIIHNSRDFYTESDLNYYNFEYDYSNCFEITYANDSLYSYKKYIGEDNLKLEERQRVFFDIFSKQNSYTELISLIEEKFDFIRYNILTDSFELYLMKIKYIEEVYKNCNEYLKEPITYLNKIMGIDNIESKINNDSNYTTMLDYREKILEFLKDNFLLNVRLNKEQQEKTLNNLTIEKSKINCNLSNIEIKKSLNKTLGYYYIYTSREGKYLDKEGKEHKYLIISDTLSNDRKNTQKIKELISKIEAK